MRPFRFRLARVRRVRDIREEIARSELLASEQTLRAAERALQDATVSLAQAQDSIVRLQEQSPIDPRAVLAADATVRGLARRVRAAHEVAQSAADAEQTAREAWLAARRDARTLGQLELRAAEIHRTERERLEGREYEELASQRGLAEATPSLADGLEDRT